MTSMVLSDDQWSDAPESVVDDNTPIHTEPRVVERREGEPLKLITDPTKAVEETQAVDAQTDAASVRSMPAVHAPSESSLNVARQSSPRPHSPLRPPSSPARSTAPRPSTPHQEHRNRRRSMAESRPSNRLSGFLTNLIHRRDATQASSRSPTVREEQQPSSSAKNSRASSPVSVPTRPTTPPPALPPPTLQELGLSLSVLTSDLSPSHFSTPPTSGAFLSPHYLLLCHAQGLDVLPLKSPPAPQPYALIRRVAFKSIVVMELRGVLVAIAGRRDGVRVYALEEIRKAVEWRMDFEVKREREKERNKAPKKVTSAEFVRDSAEVIPTPPRLVRRSSHGSTPTSSPPLIPRKPTIRKPKTAPAQPPPPSGPPPSYQTSVGLGVPSNRSRRTSVTEVLTRGSSNPPPDPDTKGDWHSSDEEAIDVVAAPSGSQALDERTSSQVGGSASQPIESTPAVLSPRTSFSRRNRPANLDLSMTRATSGTTVVPQPEPSPAPTLITLQQALSASPQERAPPPVTAEQADTDDDGDGDDQTGEGRISLAQALSESRLPDLPPAGTRRQQQPIFITNSHPIATGDDDGPTSPRTSESVSILSRTGTERTRNRNRRRWSVLEGVFSNNSTPSFAPGSSEMGEITQQRSGSVGTLPAVLPSSAPARRTATFTRTQSHRSAQSVTEPTTPTSSAAVSPPPVPAIPVGNTVNPLSSAIIAPSPPSSHSRSRFIPRIISNAFHNRKSEDAHQTTSVARPNDIDGSRKSVGALVAPQAPPPKLEYVKLPGTKGALLIKSVETAKKSFLAILCGDNGEKVELFAGTYRTALGLSRTFILPDSPRSLELQLQGDDLVEVFLVFSQNVFGLEPATVRVREVRIGRAERRAARRRARELREDAAAEGEAAAEDDINVNVSIGVSISGDQPSGADSSLIPTEHPNGPQTPNERPATTAGEDASTSATSAAIAHADEVLALATAQMGPYTTFQQLSFAPKFPLASIADEYIIPPTYPDFLDYRNTYENESNGEGNADLTQIQFSPPGLPIPIPAAPSRWYYRDPKNVVHGPWKASLMQAWYKDGLLPLDLPVRREEETEYTLLKELRQQSVDPSHPFRAPPPPPLLNIPLTPLADTTKPLLTPISLLAQPRHFGPPALFFSSRGGHSTTIVDARGRSVLKGRFLWSEDPDTLSGRSSSVSRMGDVKRVEAFDVKGDRAVLVAMRQGGLEAVDLGDALLRPADESRTVLPQFVVPPSNLSRRSPFVWRIGTPVSSASSDEPTVLASKPKSHILPTKKLSTGPSGRGEHASGDGHGDGELKEEVLFLGRKDDEIYLCERNAGSFRILKLSSVS